MRRRGQKITGNRDLVDHRQHRSSVRCMFRVQQKRVCSFLLMIQLPQEQAHRYHCPLAPGEFSLEELGMTDPGDH